MKKNLPKKWVQNLKILDVALQPILNIHTGRIFAVEALLRNYEEVGFSSILISLMQFMRIIFSTLLI